MHAMVPDPLLPPPRRHCRGRAAAGWHACSATPRSPPLCPAAAHRMPCCCCDVLCHHGVESNHKHLCNPCCCFCACCCCCRLCRRIHPRSRTTTGAPTHARRRARSSSAHSLTSSTPSSQCSPTRSHRSCAPCVPSPPPSTPMHTCPLAPHSACTAEPTKSCRARVHVPRLTLCVPRHERRRICQCSVFSSCSPASRRL